MSKLQEKPSSLKREHPALQKFTIFFLCLWVIFALLFSGSRIWIRIQEPHRIRIQ